MRGRPANAGHLIRRSGNPSRAEQSSEIGEEERDGGALSSGWDLIKIARADGLIDAQDVDGFAALLLQLADERALADLAAETGAALTFESPAQLDDALGRIGGNPVLREKLGRLARLAYNERFTADGDLPRHLSLIADLAPRQGAP